MVSLRMKDAEKWSRSSERGASLVEFALAAAILFAAMIGVNALLGGAGVAMQGKTVAAQEDAVACSSETIAVLGTMATEACK